MHFVTRHIISEHPEYFSCLDEFRMDDGGQMLLLHIDVDPLRFSPAVMKRIRFEFAALRSCTRAPLFAFEPEPDDEKWERFVRIFGFQYGGRSHTADGTPIRFFISIPDGPENHRNQEHEQPPARGADAVSARGLGPSWQPTPAEQG